jgi:hypothetical protein
MYRNILANAFTISIKKPFLWVLGIIAALSINTGIYEGSIQNIVALLQSSRFTGDIKELTQGNLFDTLFSFITDTQISVSQSFFTLVVTFALIFFVIYITTLAQIALIQKADKLSRNKAVKLENALPNAHAYFGQVFIINIISRVVYSLILVITSAPLIISLVAQHEGLITLFSLLFFFLFIPLSIGLALVTIYAILFSVLKNQELSTSIVDAWNLVKHNALISIEILITLLVVKLGAFLTTLIIAGLIFIPLAFILISLLVVNQTFLFALLVVITVLIVTILMGLIVGWYTTYYLTATTLLFNALTDKKLSSKLERSIEKLLSLLPISSKDKKALTSATHKVIARHDEIITIAQKGYTKAQPVIGKVLEKAAKKYGEHEEDLEKIQAEVKKIIEEEKKALGPTLKKAAQQISKDAPKVKKAAKKTVRAVEKKYPEVQEIREKLQRIYEDEIEAQVAKVVLQEAKKQKPTKAKRS